MDPTLHPVLEPLAFLVGTWSGRGEGEFPTTEAFAYNETVTFAHCGKPFLSYVQQTFSAIDGSPMHAESGYWRVTSTGQIEVVIAHAFGSVEISEGSLEGEMMRLKSTVVGGTSTAKTIDSVERDLSFGPNQFQYEIRMAAVGVPLTTHLEGTLKRVA